MLIHLLFLESDYVMYTSSGIVGGAEINWYLAGEIGQTELFKRIFGDNLKYVKSKEKEKVVTLTSVISHIKCIIIALTLNFLSYQFFAKSAIKRKVHIATNATGCTEIIILLLPWKLGRETIFLLKNGGWVRRSDGPFQPVQMCLIPSPESLLHVVSCSCKKVCSKTYSCQK